MGNKLIILLFLISFVLTSCSSSPNRELNVESIESHLDAAEVNKLDEDKIIRYIKKWDSDLFAISGNLSYLSDLMNVTLDDQTIDMIIQEEFDGLENGSDEYINFLIQWVKENMAHTRMQEEYRNFRGNEPWNGTYKKPLPHEMKKLGIKKNVYMGKCTSITNFTISILRKSGLSKDDYIMLHEPGHVIGIFKYNEEFYAIDNNIIVLVTDDIKEKSFKYVGYYHEDSSIIGKFTLTKDFYEYDDNISLTQRLLELHNIKETEIYKSNLNIIHRKYIEHRIDVPDFDLYIKASIEEPNVQILSRSLTGLTDVLNCVEANTELTSNEDRVQLADETIVYGCGTALDRAVLIKSLLYLKDIDSRIYHNDKVTFVEVNGEYYSTIDFRKTKLKEINEFKVY